MTACKTVLRTLCCLTILLTINLTFTVEATAQTEYLREEFSSRPRAQVYTRRNGERVRGLDRWRMAWGWSGTRSYQWRQRILGGIFPPDGTFNKNGQENDDYFLGHLLNRKGTISFNVNIRNGIDPQLSLNLAAATIPSGSNANFDTDDYVELWARPRRGREEWLIDRFKVDSGTGALTSETNGAIGSDFSNFSYNLSDVLPEATSRFRIAIVATTGLSQTVGFDDVVVTAREPGNDQCPDDPLKESPGACGCGVPDVDSDGDGTPDCNDDCAADAGKTEPGACGCGIADTDTDEDSTADCNDACPEDPEKIEAGICGCGVDDDDTDGDGTPDCNDGCPTDSSKTGPGSCGCGAADTDTDGDGFADCNDNCPTDANKTEAGICGCGVADIDTDDDGAFDCDDGCPTDSFKTEPLVCGCGVADTDADGDGTPDCNDLCPDDAAKTAPGVCGCTTPDTDADGDNTPDCIDACPVDPAKIAPGLCGCGIADTDGDGDGTPDCNDACPADPLKIAAGVCGCGTADTDGDGDGTPDCNDACPADALKIAAGVCGCGVSDADADSDGIPDCNDGCPTDVSKTEPGQCGCGFTDTDTDGDGTADCNDACPADAGKTEAGVCGCGVAETGDTDGDGTLDCVDECPADAAKIVVGICGCGVADTDTDGDGTADCNDACPADAGKTEAGVCGCGVAETGDTDGDGTLDCVDECPADAAKIAVGICGCGVADTDTDGDGTADCNDACPADAGKTEAGVCGCGVAETGDTDGDGTLDCVDECPADAAKIAVGICGCGVADTDTDGDGTADCNDACPADAAKTEAGVCGCGVPDDTPMCILNNDFQHGDLTNWTTDTSNGGSIDVMSEGGPGNFAGRMVTGSPVSLSTTANTPDESYYLTFDTKFMSTSGDLTVSINGTIVGSVGAPTVADSDFGFNQILISDELLQGLSLAPIQFQFNDSTSGTTLYIDNVVLIPGSAGEQCFIGGAAIGPDNSRVDNFPAVSCSNAYRWAIEDPKSLEFFHNNDFGTPAIEFVSDGSGVLSRLRTVTTLEEREVGTLQWSQSPWSITVWDKATYLASGAPLFAVELGFTPDNWNSFTAPDENGRDFPDTAPFAHPGNGNFSEAYEMIWDLDQFPEFSTPLPAGEYIIGFNGNTRPRFYGEAGIIVTLAGIGPTPYFSRQGLKDSSFWEPGPVIGRLSSNPDFRWAMEVSEDRLSCD